MTVGKNDAKKERLPSKAVSVAVNPSAASSAARTPLCAARPACSGLVMVPDWPSMPLAMELAMPNAVAVLAPDSPSRRLAAAAAPSVPNTPVGCQPNRPDTAECSRPMTSYPAAWAAIRSWPVLPFTSATANAAGKMGAVGWAPGSHMSSKSSACPAVAFANAASAVRAVPGVPQTDAAPGASASRRTARTAGSSDPARATPTRSRHCLATRRTRASGRSA